MRLLPDLRQGGGDTKNKVTDVHQRQGLAGNHRRDAPPNSCSIRKSWSWRRVSATMLFFGVTLQGRPPSECRFLSRPPIDRLLDSRMPCLRERCPPPISKKG